MTRDPSPPDRPAGSAGGVPPLEVLEQLGAGATGSVHRARLTAPWGELPAGTEVALKRLHADSARVPLLAEAFEREGRLACELAVPGLVRGLATGRDDGGPWLLLELLPGPTLRERLEEHGHLQEEELREVGARLARALEALHGAGHMHGDLKPENVRLDGAGRAVLLDLGYALALDEEPTRETGSLAYLAPEELRGGPKQPTSEVWSLGVLLYELATGRHPFARPGSRGDGADVVGTLLSAPLELPSLRAPLLSPFLDDLLAWALERAPEERPTPATLAELLSQGEAHPWWRSRLATGAPPAPDGPLTFREEQALPLVGRDQELEDLLVWARRALEGDPPPGGAAWLVGPAGSGKSRLVREFSARVRRGARPPLYLRGRSSRFEDQRPCQPILTLLGHYLELAPGTRPGKRARARLEDLLPTHERDALLEVLDPEFDRVTPAAIPAALCTWLVALARRRPLVVFLDDLGFADEGTLDVLHRLLRQLAELPLFLILGRDAEEEPRRPEAFALLSQRLLSLPVHEELELAPLSPAAVEELTRRLFTRSSPQLRLARVLRERSAGNPGLLTELVRGLVERGEARPTSGGLELGIHPDDLPLPRSLRAEILRAYNRLDDADRAWLERLAVAGGRIEPTFLQRAWPTESAESIERVLEHLVKSGWLRAQGDRYRFRRPALRTAIYRRLDPRTRREGHTAVAAALRRPRGERLPVTDAFQRAFHLRAAGQYEELLHLLGPLLRRLEDRGQPARVHSLGLWGLEALEHLPPEQNTPQRALELLWAAADAADRLGYRERQRDLLDRMTELELDPEADPESAGRIYLMHGRFSISVGQYGPARGLLRNALAAFEAAGDDALASDSMRRLASVQAHTGELAQARRSARDARERAPDDFLVARAEHTLGTIDLLEGRVESALRRTDRCLLLLRKVERFEVLSVRALAHSLRARVYRGAGRPRRALVSARHALRFAQRAGDRRSEIELQARLGVHLVDVERVDEGEKLLRDAQLAASEIEDRRGRATASLFLGILLAEQDDPQGARALEECVRLARDMGLSRIEAVCTAIRARIAFQSDPSTALALSAQAVTLLARAGAELIDRIVISGTHAMVLQALGRSAEAEQQLERLRRRMRTATGRIESPLLQRRQRLATGQLLRAALSPAGPVYRRVRLEGM